MSLQDSLFSEDVENDVTLFSRDRRRKRVLVFPPVNNYRRFIIHQLVQDRFTDLLHTFSIGQGAARRTVVCYKSDVIRDPKLNGVECKQSPTAKSTDTQRDMGVEGRRSPSASPERVRVQRQAKTAPKFEIYRPPAARKAWNDAQNSVEQVQAQPACDATSTAKSGRQRRPDRAVYVPRHRRSLEPDGSPQPVETLRTNRAVRENSTSSVSQGGTKNVVIKEVECCKKGSSNSRRDSSSSNKSRSGSACEVDAKGSSDSPEAPAVEARNRSAEEVREVNSVEERVPKEPESSVSPEVECERTRVEEEEDKVSNKPPSENKISLEPIEAYVYSDVNIVSKGTDESDERKDNPATPRTVEKQKTDKEISNKDEITNQKNAQHARRNVLSDVLIISDKGRKEAKNVKEISTVPMTPPEKKVKKVERPKSKPAPPPSPPIKINRDECDWDSLFDDNGDCLDPSLIDELTSAVGDVVIEQPKNDYKAYSKHVEVSSDEFAHVLEIYNFPSEFKTSDLAAVFSPFKNGGFELKWVDDTHCLGVFSSPLVAAEVLASDHPFVKTRPLSEATALSKTKARRSAEFLQPYRSRPETCAALARRLVTGALGIRLATSRQEREHEKNLLREAKEKRRLANKQREDAWEGIIPEK